MGNTGLGNARHPVAMAANRKRSAGEGLGGRIPEPIKVGLLLAWLVAIFALRWDRVKGDIWPPILWAFLGLGVGLYLILLLARVVATLGDSTRAPRELDLTGQDWGGFIILTGGLLTMAHGRPSTATPRPTRSSARLAPWSGW